MKITKKQFLDYPYLPKIIEIDKKKLQKYKDNPPVAIAGKVYGSNNSFPYQLRGFTISGPEVADNRNWKLRVRELEVKLHAEINLYSEVRLEIDHIISGISEARDKTILEYILNGRSQQSIAMELHIDQSTVSRTVDKYFEK